MAIPPGVRFVSRTILSLSPPIAIAYLATAKACNYLYYPAPSFAAFVLGIAVLWLPAVSLSRRLKVIANKRRAAALGAILPPTVTDNTPFNVGIIKTMVGSFKNGYPGEQQLIWSGKIGNVFTVHAGFGSLQYITTEPQHVKAVLATKFTDWDKGPLFQDQMKSVLGTGVFNADGDMWKFHRSITRPFFNKERISDFDIFDEHATAAVAQAKERALAGYPIEFQAKDLCSRISLDSATAFLFDNDVCSLSAGLPYPPNILQVDDNASHPSNTFAHAFSESQRQIAYRSFLGRIWSLTEMTHDVTNENMRVVNAFIEPLIDAALAKKKEMRDIKGDLKAEAGGDLEDTSLLDHLVNMTDDPVVIKDETLNIMIAGRDTIASTLTFGMYMLAEHPDVLKRLRDEVLEKVGSTARPTYEGIKEMKFLRAFINETLRLYPPVPFDIRMANKETLLPPSTPGGSPYYVPKNAQCVYSTFVMQRRTDLWGPDAILFDPDRFLDERVHKYLTPNPFIFTPFNAGPRICLGQQFAYNEISFTLIRFLQTFSSVSLALDVQPSDTIPPKEWAQAEGRQAIEKVWPKQHLTMYAHGGLWVRMGVAEEAK
ncbi:cytochrome P450 [Amylostereum chailletii]|nr:cytochrome P450 [Amylostereum chailletii]